jgi:hypothetical protein
MSTAPRHGNEEHAPMLMMSPSTSFRWSGIPWQMTSLTDLRRTAERPPRTARGAGAHSRAHRLRERAVVERRRVRLARDALAVRDLVQEVRRHARLDLRRDGVEDLARELGSGVSAGILVRGGRRTRQTVRILPCSSRVRIFGGLPSSRISAAGLPARTLLSPAPAQPRATHPPGQSHSPGARSRPAPCAAGRAGSAGACRRGTRTSATGCASRPGSRSRAARARARARPCAFSAGGRPPARCGRRESTHPWIG